MLETMASILRDHPGTVGSIGAGSGWLSVRMIQHAQFAAAVLAALVSLCTLIIIFPTVCDRLKTATAYVRKLLS